MSAPAPRGGPRKACVVGAWRYGRKLTCELYRECRAGRSQRGYGLGAQLPELFWRVARVACALWTDLVGEQPIMRSTTVSSPPTRVGTFCGAERVGRADGRGSSRKRHCSRDQQAMVMGGWPRPFISRLVSCQKGYWDEPSGPREQRWGSAVSAAPRSRQTVW